jgi:membrane-associated protein
MKYRTFLMYCIAGAVLWVSSISTLGYVLGSHPWVKAHFETVVFGIIGISLLPVLWQALKSKWG